MSGHLMSKPLVTICVPSYNKQRFVEATLDSIRRQTFREFELIIIDDCSHDDSVHIIDEWVAKHHFPCTFLKHDTNQGVCRTANEALALAQGRYFCGLGADDLWLPTFLERYAARMEQLPETVAVLYGECEEIDEHSKLVRPYSETYLHRLFERPPEGRVFNHLLRGCFIAAPTAMTRTACLRAVGGFDEALYYEDYDLWFRLAREYLFAFIPECLVQYRQAPGSMVRARASLLRISLSKNAIDRKLVEIDPTLRRYAEDQLHTWERVQALYADDDPNVARYARGAFRRDPCRWGFVMLVFILLRIPHSVFWVLDGLVTRMAALRGLRRG